MMKSWADAVSAELNLPADVNVEVILDVARVAAHSVERPAAPVTTSLLGVAVAGRDECRPGCRQDPGPRGDVAAVGRVDVRALKATVSTTWIRVPSTSAGLAHHQYRNKVPQHQHGDLASSRALCHSSVLSDQHSCGCVKFGTKRPQVQILSPRLYSRRSEALTRVGEGLSAASTAAKTRQVQQRQRDLTCAPKVLPAAPAALRAAPSAQALA